MRKISVTGILALALTLGTAGIAAAQGTARPNRQHADSTFRGRGGQAGLLLRGITLSASQQTRLKELRANERKQMQAEHPQGQRDAGARAARQRGDTTGMGARRAQMMQRREQQFAAIRGILNNDQRVQFDKNVTDLKARMSQRGERGEKREHRDGAAQH
ncbi:MAG: Spy/CpxP family protein refolding chaperone [bacterium]